MYSKYSIVSQKNQRKTDKNNACLSVISEIDKMKYIFSGMLNKCRFVLLHVKTGSRQNTLGQHSFSESQNYVRLFEGVFTVNM